MLQGTPARTRGWGVETIQPGCRTARGLGQPCRLGHEVQDADPSLGVAVAG